MSKTVTIDDEKEIIVPKDQLQTLLEKINEYEKKEEEIATVCLKAMKTIGLADEHGKMKPEADEGKGVFKILIATFKEKISVSDYMFNRKKFEADLAKEFDFLDPLLKIGADYAAKKQIKM